MGFVRPGLLLNCVADFLHAFERARPVSTPPDLRFRQIHLDFHTSEHIPGIGADFDPEDFAKVLDEAAVDSVTCFARCHHGYLYYPSQKNPERIHPRLERPELLNEQIAACRKRGIRVPIYITVQWDHYTAREHPEWLCVEPSTKALGANDGVFGPGFYRFLDVFHPGYRAFLAENTREVLETFDADGLFFDIVQPRASCAWHWIEAMDARGIDPEDAAAREGFAREVINDWKLEMTELVRSINPDCTIFYNAGHVGPRHRPSRGAYTHYELESLPSGGWGYLHFPLAVRYARNLGKPYLGMTGKFQTSWGDFHSYKNLAALEYECFTMLSHGAACSVGDQLHPRGAIDRATYDLVGKVYRRVRDKQPWCERAEAVTDIAVITPEAFQGGGGAFAAQAGKHPTEALGLTRMFEELKLQFDVLDPEHDLAGYKLVVLPDRVPVEGELLDKLNRYLDSGGAVLASYGSGIDAKGEGFTLGALGVELRGEAEACPDFLVPGGEIGKDLPAAPHTMYLRGMKVAAKDGGAGGEVLCHVESPYFERQWRKFCSHRHTPSSGEVAQPGVIAKGRCVYFSHRVFDEYYHHAPKWVKAMVKDAVDLLLPERCLEVEGPSTLHATLMRQPEHGRLVAHLLHYVPEKRAANYEVIEEAIPLQDVPVTVRSDQPLTRASLEPQGRPLELEHAGEGRYRVTAPVVDGHAMVVLS